MLPPDGGPLYAETDLSRFPVEPWNTVTILPFLLIPLYWIWKLRGDWKNNPLIALSIPLLLIGFVGGGLYHALRNNRLWLVMDYLPIAILAFTGSMVFWMRLWRHQRKRFIAAASFVVCETLLSIFFTEGYSRQTLISMSYVQLAMIILLPVYLDCAGNAGRGLRWLNLAFASFVLAVTCRVLDFLPGVRSVLPMGTHFLWHLFGAAACFGLLQFLFELNCKQYTAYKMNSRY